MIHRAIAAQADIITELFFQSKAYWNYSKEHMEVFQRELTVTSEYINTNDVFVYVSGGIVKGCYSLVILEEDITVSGITIKKGLWLEHMFVLPEYIGQGIGKEMFMYMIDYCRQKPFKSIGILADPNAKGFYQKMSCDYIREYPSIIKGRTTPYLSYSLA